MAEEKEPKNNIQEINITLEPDEPKNFSTKLSTLQDKAMNISRMNEQGIINEKTGAAVVVRDDGQINMSSSKHAQYKLSPGGRASEVSMESITMTNRKKFVVDDFVINEHKLNPQLWEYRDFRTAKLLTNQDAVVGGLCMMGSVLVKAWEPHLNRYVLIRRPWMGPVFGTTLNVAEINPALEINDPLKLEEDILALSDKGYQVNGVIRDAKSLIGKQGQDRSGITRGADANSTSDGGSSGGGYTGKSSGALGSEAMDPKKCWDILRGHGYSEIATAAIMGNIRQESTFNPKADSESHRGLAQWDISGRWAALEEWAKSANRDPYDGGTQIDYIVYEANNIRYTSECGLSGMNAIVDLAKANRQWVAYYEGATDGHGGYQEEAERLRFAQEFYDAYHKK